MRVYRSFYMRFYLRCLPGAREGLVHSKITTCYLPNFCVCIIFEPKEKNRSDLLKYSLIFQACHAILKMR
jgi:hypothetical protein